MRASLASIVEPVSCVCDAQFVSPFSSPTSLITLTSGKSVILLLNINGRTNHRNKGSEEKSDRYLTRKQRVRKQNNRIANASEFQFSICKWKLTVEQTPAPDQDLRFDTQSDPPLGISGCSSLLRVVTLPGHLELLKSSLMLTSPSVRLRAARPDINHCDTGKLKISSK